MTEAMYLTSWLVGELLHETMDLSGVDGLWILRRP